MPRFGDFLPPPPWEGPPFPGGWGPKHEFEPIREYDLGDHIPMMTLGETIGYRGYLITRRIEDGYIVDTLESYSRAWEEAQKTGGAGAYEYELYSSLAGALAYINDIFSEAETIQKSMELEFIKRYVRSIPAEFRAIRDWSHSPLIYDDGRFKVRRRYDTELGRVYGVTSYVLLDSTETQILGVSVDLDDIRDILNARVSRKIIRPRAFTSRYFVVVPSDTYSGGIVIHRRLGREVRRLYYLPQGRYDYGPGSPDPGYIILERQYKNDPEGANGEYLVPVDYVSKIELGA